VATAPFSGIAGFHLSGLYSPWRSFGQIVKDFLRAKDDPEKLKVWTNTRLGESFDTQGGEGLEWQKLMARCEPYAPLTVPMGGLLLTAGVDVQGDRLACSVWAWGVGEECWLVYHTEIYGDPTEERVWGDLDALLETKFTHASGSELGITAAGIDCNYKGNDVYNFVRLRSTRNIYAVAGQPQPGKPIIGRPSLQEVNWRGKVLKKGVRRFPVGSDTAKGVIYSRLRITVPGAGYIHFPIGIEEEFFEQLTAEKVVTRYSKGFSHQEWVKTRNRNEALDCLVYALAVAYLMGIQRLDWVKLARLVIPEKVEEPEREAIAVKSRKTRSQTSYAEDNFATNY
jgi:phage terminase large subunit GpA-like protein